MTKADEIKMLDTMIAQASKAGAGYLYGTLLGLKPFFEQRTREDLFLAVSDLLYMITNLKVELATQKKFLAATRTEHVDLERRIFVLTCKKNDLVGMMKKVLTTMEE